MATFLWVVGLLVALLVIVLCYLPLLDFSNGWRNAEWKKWFKERHKIIQKVIRFGPTVVLLFIIFIIRLISVRWVNSGSVNAGLPPSATAESSTEIWSAFVVVVLVGLAIWAGNSFFEEKVPAKKPTSTGTIEETPEQVKAREQAEKEEREGRRKKFWDTYGVWLTAVIIVVGAWIAWPEFWGYLVTHWKISFPLAGLVVLFIRKEGSKRIATGSLLLILLLFLGKAALPSDVLAVIGDKTKDIIEGKWSPPPTHNSPKSGAERSATTSRVTTRRIVAKPGEWSEQVSVPFGQSWSIEPEGKIKVLTASGKTWDDWPGKVAVMRTDPSILDSMFQFMPIEEKEVKVIVVWEPR